MGGVDIVSDIILHGLLAITILRSQMVQVHKSEPSSLPMASWTIEPVQPNDLEEYVQCQFVAFVGNPLHDVVYPTQPTAVETHLKAVEDGSKLQAGNEIVYLKAVDKASGKIVGGIKFCIYAGEDVRSNSPYAAGISDVEAQPTEEDKYRVYVLNEFLGKRVRDIKGQHARKFFARSTDRTSRLIKPQ